jgi:hypothetical protein
MLQRVTMLDTHAQVTRWLDATRFHIGKVNNILLIFCEPKYPITIYPPRTEDTLYLTLSCYLPSNICAPENGVSRYIKF